MHIFNTLWPVGYLLYTLALVLLYEKEMTDLCSGRASMGGHRWLVEC